MQMGNAIPADPSSLSLYLFRIYLFVSAFVTPLRKWRDATKPTGH